MKKVLFILIAGTLLASCSTQSIIVKEARPAGQVYLAEDTMQHFLIGGVGQKQEINVVEICGGEEYVYKVETELTFLNVLLASFTGNAYTPRQVRVYCIQK